MKITENMILIIVILIESLIFLTINKRKEIQMDYKDGIVVEIMEQKVDSIRQRNANYFLLTLELNNIIENNRNTKRLKFEDGRIIDLMLKVGE